MTHTILLRNVPNKTDTPHPIDKRHESELTELAKYFDNTLSLVSKIANHLKCGLGSVALVRLKPHGMVYKHSDLSIRLQNRNR